MEENQTIITTAKPRVTINKISSGFNYNIASSESGSLEEIKKIVDELVQALDYIKGKLPKQKEGVLKKK